MVRKKRIAAVLLGVGVCILYGAGVSSAAEAETVRLDPRVVDRTLEKAADFWLSISTKGGWCGKYTLDLKKRWGESERDIATEHEIWIHPPGTHTIGQTLLRAYRLTGRSRYLKAARNTGLALAWGQLDVGGWAYLVSVGHATSDIRNM